MEDNNSIGSIIVLVLLIWGGTNLWNWIFPSDSNDYDYPSSYTSSYSSDDSQYNSDNCSEPENPYDDGSGHYAGFEWGENGNSCDGNSDSFIEGCEEYESQEEAYQSCLSS
jgi:hypothetical protein